MERTSTNDDREREPLLSGAPDVPQSAAVPLGFHDAWPFILLGLAIGTLPCMTNTYFGLKTGHPTGFTYPLAVLCYPLLRRLGWQWTARETTVIVITATTVAGNPLVMGLMGPIPALEFLTEAEDPDHTDFAWWRLLVWAVGASPFGIFLAWSLKKRFLVDNEEKRLPFRSAKATRVLIERSHEEANSSKRRDPLGSIVSEGEDSEQAQHGHAQPRRQCGLVSKRWLTPFAAYVLGAGLWTVLAEPVKVLHHWNVFGNAAWTYGCWGLDLSPGLIGQGIIAGEKVSFDALLGAAFGWGLMPYVWQKYAWGLINCNESREDCIQMANVWPALAALMAGCLAPLIARILTPVFWTQGSTRVSTRSSSQPEHTQEIATVAHSSTESGTYIWMHTFRSILLWVALVTAMYVGTQLSTQGFLHWYISPISMTVGCLLAIMGTYAVGYTGILPAAALGRASQLILAGVSFVLKDTHGLFTNLMAGAVAESASCAAPDTMAHFKLGDLLDIPLIVLLWSHLFGALWGAVVSTTSYKVLSRSDRALKVPMAIVWHTTAKLFLGEGIPKKTIVPTVCTLGVFFVIDVTKGVLQEKRDQDSWLYLARFVKFLPSGTSFALGMINVPGISMAWALGAVICHLYGARSIGSRAQSSYVGDRDRELRDNEGLRESGKTKDNEANSTKDVMVLAGGLTIGEGLVQLGISILKLFLGKRK